jgi:hypothetical protein
MRSTLAQGEVWHRRTSPKAYVFRYGVYYVHLDLDELEEVDRRVILFGYNRPNVLSFRDSDHMAGSHTTLREAVNARLSARGIDPDAMRVSLLTNTRVAGYVFNPVSFYFVRDRATDRLQFVIAEVHNTHGEEHIYDLLPEAGSEVYRSSAEKQFYVSPFIEMEGRYVFTCRELPSGGYDLRIDEFEPGEPRRGAAPFFQARLKLHPVPLSNGQVAKMLVRYPLITAQTVALIHWQGLKLWVRGVRYRKHRPKAPALQ